LIARGALLDSRWAKVLSGTAAPVATETVGVAGAVGEEPELIAEAAGAPAVDVEMADERAAGLAAGLAGGVVRGDCEVDLGVEGFVTAALDPVADAVPDPPPAAPLAAEVPEALAD
jgi:hypothetical protein